MKVSKKRTVKHYEPEELRSWTTRRLLSLRDRLLRCEEALADSDWESADVDPSRITFKDDPRWLPLYEAVRLLLGDRGHVTADPAATGSPPRDRERAPRPKRQPD